MEIIHGEVIEVNNVKHMNMTEYTVQIDEGEIATIHRTKDAPINEGAVGTFWVSVENLYDEKDDDYRKWIFVIHFEEDAATSPCPGPCPGPGPCP